MMKSIRLLLILTFLLSSCDLIDQMEKCDETNAPEINFELLVGGQVKILSKETGNDVTALYEDADMTVFFNKIYCDGTNKGPFEEYFALDKYGVMWRNSIGRWSFRMDNKDDYMRISFFIDGKEVGKYNLDYDMLKMFDTSTAYIEFLIDCEHTESSVDNDIYGKDIRITN